MDNKNEHIRHVLLYYYNKGKTATNTHTKIIAVYGKDIIKLRTCQKWFKKFRTGNFSLQDEARSGRPINIIKDDLKALIDDDRHISVRQLAEILHSSKTSIADRLRKLGYSKKLDVWVPHHLTESQLLIRITTCDILLKRNRNEPFLKRLITGDEKWIVYNNIQRKRSWCKHGEPAPTTSHPDIHQRKVMLSIWWDYKGIIYFEIQPKNVTINSNIYCEQLTNLNEALKKKRPELANRKGIVFHHDNARPHTSLVTQKKLLELGWDVLPHPPYSPDIAPSDYHLFRSLQNSLVDKTFTTDSSIKLHLESFVEQKDKYFFESGIMALAERWEQIIVQNGAYIC